MKTIKIRITPNPDEPPKLGCPKLEFHISVENPVAIRPKTRDVITSSELGTKLGKLGFKTVIWYTTHGSHVSVEKYVDHEVLRMFNFAVPTHRYDNATRQGRPHTINGVKIASNGQSDYRGIMGFSRKKGGRQLTPDFRVHEIFPDSVNQTEAVENIDAVMLDDYGSPAAVFGENWVTVSFDLQHSANNQDLLMGEILRKYIQWKTDGKQKEPESPPKIDDFTTEDLVTHFKHGYHHMLEGGTREEYVQRSRNKVRGAFRAYLKMITDEVKNLQHLDGLEELSEEAIIRRGEMVMENMKKFSEIRGVALRGGFLRVITHKLRSDRWLGEKALGIWIPLNYETLSVTQRSEGGIYEGRIIVKEIDEVNEGLLPGPVDQSCLGSLRYSFDVNMLSGDWDMAVRVLLQSFTNTASGKIAGYGERLSRRDTDLGYGQKLESE
jgi:hypothetical protein